MKVRTISTIRFGMNRKQVCARPFGWDTKLANWVRFRQVFRLCINQHLQCRFFILHHQFLEFLLCLGSPEFHYFENIWIIFGEKFLSIFGNSHLGGPYVPTWRRQCLWLIFNIQATCTKNTIRESKIPDSKRPTKYTQNVKIKSKFWYLKISAAFINN